MKRHLLATLASAACLSVAQPVLAHGDKAKDSFEDLRREIDLDQLSLGRDFDRRDADWIFALIVIDRVLDRLQEQPRWGGWGNQGWHDKPSWQDKPGWKPREWNYKPWPSQAWAHQGWGQDHGKPWKDIKDNWNPGGPHGDWYCVTPVPDAGGLATMMAGLGGLGGVAAWRRRRKG